MTPLEIARNESIPVVERIERLLTTETLGHRGFFEVLATIVERALSRVESPDPRSVAVVGVLRRHAAERLLERELHDVYTNSWAVARASYGMRISCRMRQPALAAASAACAMFVEPSHTARAVADAASWVAVSDVEQERCQQLADIIAALEAQSASAS